MQDDEYIPHGENIEAFLKREIAKPIIRWEDSRATRLRNPAKQILLSLPAANTPAKDLLEQFWKLEKEAEKVLEGLADLMSVSPQMGFRKAYSASHH